MVANLRIILSAFKLASLNSFESKIKDLVVVVVVKTKVNQAKFDTYRKSYDWQPFVKTVYRTPVLIFKKLMVTFIEAI